MPPTIFTDVFSGTAGTLLENHSPSGGSGGPWVKHADMASGSIAIDFAGNALIVTAVPTLYYPSSVTPPSADYAVQGAFICRGLVASGSSPYLCGRASVAAGTVNRYQTRFLANASTDGGGTWQLYRIVPPGVQGTPILIGSWVAPAGHWTNGMTRTARMEMVGSNLRLLVDGVERINVNDTNITQVGVPGIASQSSQSQSGQWHLVNISVDDLGLQPPANTVAPALTTDGTPQTNETISCSTGTWSNSPTAYTYQWKRDGTNISGATSSTYVLTSTDETHSVSCAVTATNAGGSTTASSNSITGLPPSPAVVTNPVVSTDGTPQTTETISVSNGTWTNSPTSYTYQWQRDGVNIAGATVSTYTIQPADEGTSLRCVVSATNAGGTTQAVSNSVTANPQIPVNTSVPQISGAAFAGQTVTCSTGAWNSSPTSYAYQWKRDSVTISGATSSTYTIAPSDTSAVLSCTVTATNSSGSASATSNGVIVGTAPTLNDLVHFYLSGGVGNTNGQASIGGAKGSTLSNAPQSLFPNVAGTEARAGLVDYRLVYIQNSHTTTTSQNTVVYIDSAFTTASIRLDIGVALEGVDADVPAIPNDRTAPAGVTFSAPTNAASGIPVGNLHPNGGYRGIWIRRTVLAGTAPFITDTSTLAWEATPA